MEDPGLTWGPNAVGLEWGQEFFCISTELPGGAEQLT
jgi:hypothetical protein